jgi:hypothetical protein
MLRRVTLQSVTQRCRLLAVSATLRCGITRMGERAAQPFFHPFDPSQRVEVCSKQTPTLCADVCSNPCYH